LPFNADTRPEPKRKVPRHDLDGHFVDDGIIDSCDGVAPLDANDPDAQSVQGLGQFDPHGTEPQDGDGLGECFLIEQGLDGQEAVLEGVPLWRYEGARTGRYHCGPGVNGLVTDPDGVRIDELRIALDELVAHVVRGVGEDQIDEHVAQVPDALHGLGPVDPDALAALDAELGTMGPVVMCLGQMQRHLGRHAANSRTGCAELAAVDKHVVFGDLSNLLDGIRQNGSPRTTGGPNTCPGGARGLGLACPIAPENL